MLIHVNNPVILNHMKLTLNYVYLWNQINQVFSVISWACEGAHYFQQLHQWRHHRPVQQDRAVVRDPGIQNLLHHRWIPTRTSHGIGQGIYDKFVLNLIWNSQLNFTSNQPKYMNSYRLLCRYIEPFLISQSIGHKTLMYFIGKRLVRHFDLQNFFLNIDFQ